MEREYYDLSLLITSKLSEEEAQSFFQQIISLAQEEGALVDKIENPKKIRLAYPIKKEESAYFGWFTFFFPKEKIESLQENLKKKEEILRMLLAKQKPQVKRESKKDQKEQTKLEKIEKVKLEEIEKKLEELI